MLEIVSSAHRVPRAEGARRREEGTVQRTVLCVAYRSGRLSLASALDGGGLKERVERDDLNSVKPISF